MLTRLSDPSWIVKRGGRRIDPAVNFFQEGDTLEFVGSSMEEDHTLRLRYYGPVIGYRINRGPPSPDNPRIELRYANNCFLKCCTKFFQCIRDLFGTGWRQESANRAHWRRRTIASEGEDQRDADFRPAADMLALADQLEQLAAQIEAAEAPVDLDPPVDDITRVSVRQRDESEHDFQFWDNLLEESPERPPGQINGGYSGAPAEGNSVIDLIPFPNLDDYRPDDAQNPNAGGIELIPIQGQLQQGVEGVEDIEAQLESANNDELNVAFRGPLDRTYR
ncbi:hypothetical protein TWF481_000545 [Arthrobotrys musiformis]|uniref:Uncharacterized protein n=1 Tax=Arthrobotrys musiformis TaxID=47236 RepID=A0AAV9WTN0_9PEZI